MKHFIYTVERRTRDRKTGHNLFFRVHQIVKNKPEWVGETSANTGAYKGDKSTVNDLLVEKGLVPPSKDGYFKTNNKYELHEL